MRCGLKVWMESLERRRCLASPNDVAADALERRCRACMWSVVQGSVAVIAVRRLVARQVVVGFPRGWGSVHVTQVQELMLVLDVVWRTNR
mmetsp:Transcript_4769/g.13303  ORF Transcript_4769/g.13303 Transcript_4769/m.13303 type:complete len:90 (-) Transcript_4769:171-440(-)